MLYVRKVSAERVAKNIGHMNTKQIMAYVDATPNNHLTDSD